MSFLSPQWLIGLIPEISILIGAALLILFSDVVEKGIIFPIVDSLRRKTKRRVRVKTQGGQMARNWLSSSVAAVVFIFYIYLVEFIIAEYVFEPILYKLKAYILIVVLVLFGLLAYVLGSPMIRRKLLNV